MAAHSWSLEYRRSSGTFVMGVDPTGAAAGRSRSWPRRSGPQELAQANRVLLGPGRGAGLARPLGPDVGQGLLGVGQDQAPAVVLGHLDPVDEHQVPVGHLLDQGPHDEALLLPG